MPTTIDDKIISDTLYLNRFDAGQRQQVESLLKEMRKDLLSILETGYVVEYKKRQINALINEIDLVINEYYNLIGNQLDIDSLFSHVTDTTKLALQSAIPSSIAVVLPTVTHMKSIISNILFDGSPLLGWWDKQASDTRFKFAGLIRQGILQGTDYTYLINPVTELLAVSERNAFGMVHTSIQTIANHARMAVFEENSDVIKSLVWRTTMDSHACLLCIGRSNKRWTVDRKPIGHEIPFQLPPIHIRDRCVISAQSIFTPDKSHPDFTRASSIGQIDVQTTFDEYLKRVPSSQVEKMLGKGRYELWRDGKITTSQLLDQTGRELTLVELVKMYDN